MFPDGATLVEVQTGQSEPAASEFVPQVREIRLAVQAELYAFVLKTEDIELI